MGIHGLLPFLANSTSDAHISMFENQYVGIDAYCWLHKGIYSCSYELAMKKPTDKYVSYCLRYIEMLRHFKVKPILVFDGRNLMSKQETEKKRREERTRKYKKGLELIRAGKMNEGRQLLGESVDVSHELALNLMKACREMNVDCVVAPFEADAQLSFLSRNKTVACIITEDSDLLPYGSERVMFKMDKSGRGKLIERSSLFMSLGMEADEFSEDKFRYMCILSGCDYLPSLPSIGLANALKFVKLIGDKNIIEMLPHIPTYLSKKKVTVTPEYIRGFKIADSTFKHQLVYDPFQRKQVPLNPVENDDEIVGEKLPDCEAFQLAIGNVDPITMTKMHDYNPDKCSRGFDILWRTNSSSTNMQKEQISNFNHSQNGGIKRFCEVTKMKNEAKKNCTLGFLKNNKLQERETSNGVPQTGFIFEPKNSKVNSDAIEETNFLQSRYFVSKKKTPAEDKTNRSVSKKKDESYEEYLQRLYEEHFSEDEKCSGKNDDEMTTDKNVNKIDQNNLTQELDACISEFQKIKKNKKENVENHSLLNEMAKMEVGKNFSENAKSGGIDRVFTPVKRKDSFVKETPSPKIFSFEHPIAAKEPQRKDSKTNSEIKDLAVTFEKENQIDNSKIESSPVFKVRHRHKILNEEFKFEDETLDTVSTPASFYFSASFTETMNHAFSTSNSIRKLHSTPRRSSLPSKTNKNACKNLSSRKTLFQFGFKKENKEDVRDATQNISVLN